MCKIILAIALSLSLSGCLTLQQVETAVHFGTVSVANPVTPTRLNQMENGLKVLFAGLNAWKRSCVQGLIPDVCKQQIKTVQVYTLQLKPYLAELRSFVKNNDQVNAVVVFNELTGIISTVRAKAAESGQSLPLASGA